MFSTDIALLRFSRRAMATTFEVVLPWGTPRADAAASEALDLIDRLESQLTVYRETSEVSRLNRLAAKAPVPVEAELFKLLTLAARIADETGGAFDLTAGPLIKAWGFFMRRGRIPEDAELAYALSRVGMQHLELTPDRHAVRFARKGMEINLGSIGKGYALNQVAEYLRDRWGITSALLNGGTSSVLALGRPPGNPNGWEVGLRHPWEPRRLGTLRLRDRALASSGATYQHFAYNNRKLGHLLDPRIGRPAEGIALTAALAPSAAEADALSTAFFVLGLAGTRDYCERHPDIGAIVLTDEGDAQPIALNVTAADWRLAPPSDTYANPICGEFE